MLVYISLIIFSSLSYAIPLIEKAEGPTVTIANGVVVGTSTSIANQPSNTGLVNSYLGIPFAQNPPLRFAPPQPAQPWASPMQATKLKPACIQQFIGPKTGKLQDNLKRVFNNPGGAPPEESEDCLYLNVYAPPGASSTNQKPVMFWIFGGNLMFGTGSLDFYNGASLAVNQDVVVVTINYRTNIFGFSNSPELPQGSANAGFLDQRLALQWVQQNIAQFGGDPAKVLIYGESAGGYSVKQLLANPPSPLPFAAAIMESQQAAHPFNGLKAWNRVLSNFQCERASSPIECMRGIPAEVIRDYIEAKLEFFPPVHGDGSSSADVRAQINMGKFAKVPVLMGTNANEGRVFASLLGLENSTAFVDFVGGWLGINVGKGIGKFLADRYSGGVNNGYKSADRLLTDLPFTCPTSTLSTYLAKNGYDVWRYHYGGVYPNMAIFAPHPEQGAYHTAEIPQVFGTYGINSTPEQIELSKKMQSIWAGMAKNGAAGPGWPKVTGGKGMAMLGNKDGGATMAMTEGGEVDQACGSYNSIAQVGGLAW